MMVKRRADRFESYEVYDDEGRSVGCVILPRRARFLGRREGTVYLRHQPRLQPASRPKAA